MGKPEPIHSILPSILEKLQGRSDRQIEALWRKFLGRSAAKTRIEGHRGGRLNVLVDNASLLYELSLQKEELVQKFEKALGTHEVQEIHLRIGDIR